MPVQFGLTVPISSMGLPGQAFNEKTHAALDMISGHFDSVWCADHVQFGEREILEGWTLLSYFAGMHPSLKYGHLVLCQFFRNPALLAKMAATFQYLSQGKFILGIGAGWAEEEAHAYNLPFASAGQRVSELEEQVQIITKMWREDHVTFEGKYYQVHDANCIPRPDPLPTVFIAGRQPRMLRLVARYADWWNIGVDKVETAKEYAQKLDVACEAVGRDPRTIRRTAMITCTCAPTEEKVQELVSQNKNPMGSGFTGTPAQIVEQLQPIVAAGYDYFMVSAGGFPHDLTSLELLVHEVLPALNQA